MHASYFEEKKILFNNINMAYYFDNKQHLNIR